MDDLSIGSSIDGDLNDFLQTQGILSGKTSSYEETKITRGSELRTDRDLGNEVDIEIHEESLFLDNSVSNEEGTSISGIDTADVLLSSCKKVNALLNRYGHFPVQLTSSDINNSNQTISVFLVDSWASTILPALLEITERQSVQNNVMKDVNISAWKEEISKDSMQNKIRDLRQKLTDLERKDDSSQLKIHELSRELEKRSASIKTLEDKCRRDSRNFKEIMKNKTSEFQQTVQDLDKKERHASAQVIELKKILAKTDASTKSLTDRNRKESKNVAQSMNEIDQLHQQLSDVERKEKAASQKVSQLSEELEKANANIKEMDEKHRKITKQNLNDNELLQQKLTALERKEKIASQKASKLEEELNSTAALAKDLDEKQRKTSKDVSQGLSNSELLQQKLADLERKEKVASRKAIKLTEELENMTTNAKDLDDQRKKEIRNLELVVSENERKVRQKEVELERLREKLRQNVEKDRHTQMKHKQILNSMKQGNTMRNNIVTENEVIEALVSEHQNLKVRNNELNKQVGDLTDSLKGSQNASSAENSTDIHDSSDSISHDSDLGDDDGNLMVEDQFRRIEFLSHRVEVLQVQSSEKEELLDQQKHQILEMQDEIENLRLELDARPSSKQWAQKQREMKELEDKLHDAVMMRNETAEIESWKKHLSTRERIKADRRNFELGLWLIDSLPKAVMKEALQTVCRELNVSDISEIKPSLDKLKAVMTSVPRMERFISDVCSFVFTKANRLRGEDPNSKPMIEEVLQILKSWWAGLQQGLQLDSFRKSVLAELARRENIINTVLAGDGSTQRVVGINGDLFSIVYQNGMRNRAPKAGNVLEVIRDMIEFQCDSLKQNNNYTSLQNFIADNPEDMSSRILSHIQYMWGVKSIEGIVPKLNEVYIHTKELSTFLKNCRDLLGISTPISDASLFAEIEKMISERRSGNDE